MEGLIAGYRFELVEDHHHPGSGQYGLLVSTTEDISPAMPYLNAVMDGTYYDAENCILIGNAGRRRYAFRPHEIQTGSIPEPSVAAQIAAEAIDFVNRAWRDRESISPSFSERKLPPVYSVFRLLPRVACDRPCGHSACLAFAESLRNGRAHLEQCHRLLTDEFADNRKILADLLSPR